MSGYPSGPLPGGFPERDADPYDYTTGWERPPFACGCGRGCVNWDDHAARVDKEDIDDEREARADRAARFR